MRVNRPALGTRLVHLIFAVLLTNTPVHSGAASPLGAGDLDPSFGGDGMVLTDVARESDWVEEVLVQPDGKILAVGETSSHPAWPITSDLALVRYLSDGSLDTTFGTDGQVVSDLGGVRNLPSAAVLQSDGKIVVVGRQWRADHQTDLLIARYLPDGTLDSEFGLSGVATTDLLGADDFATAIAIQCDGKLLVAGTAADLRQSPGGSTYYISRGALIRYNLDGSLDLTFDGDGILLSGSDGDSVGLFGIEWSGLQLQTDGQIVAAGTYNNIDLHNTEMVVGRFNPDGTLDTTFGIDGLVTSGLPGLPWYFARDLAIQSDGKLVVVGDSVAGGGAADQALIVVARYLPDGSPDFDFGDDGRVMTPSGGVAGYAWDVALQPDGKILVAGNLDNDVDIDSVVIRYLSDGSLDPAFGQDGLFITQDGEFDSGLYPPGSPDDSAKSIALQPDGEIVMGGPYFSLDPSLPAPAQFYVARLLADGVPALDCPVVDNFDRANGPLGRNWIGGLGHYVIRHGQVWVWRDGPIVWRNANEPFGAHQVACLTITKVIDHGRQGLLLKVLPQSNNQYKRALRIYYQRGVIRVESYVRSQAGPFNGWWRLAEFPAQFTNGDVLGVEALADGTIRVYDNGHLIGLADTTTQHSQTFVDQRGYAGVWYDNAIGARFDDFAAGDVP